MQNLTLAAGLLAATGIMLFGPSLGLGIYLAALLLYPSYLSVPVFGYNVTAQRIATAALLFRGLTDGSSISNFKMHLLDKLVIAMFVVGFVTMSMTMSTSEFAKTYSGQLMDSTLVYFAFRLTLTSRQRFIAVIKTVSVLLFVAAVIGVTQSITGKSLYDGLYAYCPWNVSGSAISVRQRIGLFRANGPYGVHIMFGLSFVAFLPLILLLRREGKIWKSLSYVFFAAAAAGSFSSLSAGPYLGVITIFLCLLLKHRRIYIKPLLITLGLTVLAGQLISSRGFFYLMERFTFSEGTAWYRARLIDVALAKLPQYWLFGYGMTDPGWGPLIDTRAHTDLCNQYILQLVYHGLAGLLIFVSVLWAALAGLYHFRRYSTDQWSKEAAWLVGSAVVAMIAAFFSVGVFGKFTAVFYSLLGIAGCFYASKTGLNTQSCLALVPGREK